MAKATKKQTSTVTDNSRQRYSRSERREMILEGAVNFFSERGFDASTHQLAEVLGVTQPLIYSYFPSKEDLFEAVYKRVFIGRYRDEWDVILKDRTQPLNERLVDFYGHYGEVIQSTEWMRIYLYSGLKSLDLNRWYIELVEDRIIRRICLEVRVAYGLPDAEEIPISPEEMEAVWTLHGGIFYYGVRRYVYDVPVGADFADVAGRAIETFLNGFPMMAKKLVQELSVELQRQKTGENQ